MKITDESFWFRPDGSSRRWWDNWLAGKIFAAGVLLGMWTVSFWMPEDGPNEPH